MSSLPLAPAHEIREPLLVMSSAAPGAEPTESACASASGLSIAASAIPCVKVRRSHSARQACRTLAQGVSPVPVPSRPLCLPFLPPYFFSSCYRFHQPAGQPQEQAGSRMTHDVAVGGRLPRVVLATLVYAGAVACYCNPGYAQSQGEVTGDVCEACPAGKFASGSGNTVCAPCPNHMTSPPASTSSTNCSCASGWFHLNASMCAACPRGKYKAAWFLYSQCEQCAGGKYAPSNGSSACLPCQAGKYAPSDSSACLSCPPGRTSRQSVGAALSDCFCERAGFIVNSSGACVPCPAGTFSRPGSHSCQDCQSGKFNFYSGASSCKSCLYMLLALPGFFSPDTGASCAACPHGKFSTEFGATSCIACSPNSSTLSLAAASNQSCLCLDPYTGPVGGPCIIKCENDEVLLGSSCIKACSRQAVLEAMRLQGYHTQTWITDSLDTSGETAETGQDECSWQAAKFHWEYVQRHGCRHFDGAAYLCAKN